ncbi:hypothetical protein CPB97_001060 [Podila verticillata]|nr:hypothetical protein CPB97_001060 [Podila verticillata]
MPQLRAIMILAIVSALATVCYLSLWSNLDFDRDNSVFNNIHKAANHFRPHQTHDQETQPSSLQQPETHREDKQPTPSLTQQLQHQPMVSQNNARLAAQDNKAFVSFCSANQADRDAASSITLENDATFTSYTQWIEHINNKNTPRQQQQQQLQHQAVFMERPLNGWVINLTSLAEPCNRLIHSSAHCLTFLTQEHEYLIPATPEQKGATAEAPIMDFHIFWRGPISDKLSLSAHSFIFTQPLERSHLHLWIDSADLLNGEPEDYTQNQFSAPLVSPPLNKYITIHVWDQEAELMYAYPEDMNDDDDDETEPMKLEDKVPVKPVALSDEARFLILNRNGGIYLDADVLLLKDMSPFYDSGLEFAYEWSKTRMYNTAILRLYKESTVARRILDGARAREKEIQAYKLQALKQQENQGKEANRSINAGGEASEAPESLRLVKRGEMRPEEIYHPARLRKYLRPQDSRIEGNGLIMMSPAVFDPNWLRVDHAEAKSTDSEKMVEDLKSFPDAFSVEEAVCSFQQQQQAPQFTAGPEVFFQGAYAYHWHNNWATPIDPKSWMGHMRRAYDDFVAGRRPNLYGEML